MILAVSVLASGTGCGTESHSLPAALPRDGNEQIAALLEPVVREHRLPAMAAAIVTSAGLQAAAAIGFRKWNENEPVTVKDRWHLGSDTKAMTAVLAARFVEQGILRWDTRVEEVFAHSASEFHPEARTVTLTQLLQHRAGLVPNLDWSPYWRPEKSKIQEQRLAATREALTQPPTHTPGTHTVYSNLGYVVVGAMLEELSGQAWEDLIAKELFQPLGMREVGQGGMGTLGQLDQPWGHTASGNPARGYGPDQDNPPVLGPAGRVHASLASWALFIADQLRGARGEPALLKPETYQELHRTPEGSEHALGWLVLARDWGGGLVLTHAGSNTMHYALAWVAPRRDFAVLICTNQGDAVAAQAADQAAGLLIRWFLDEARPSL